MTEDQLVEQLGHLKQITIRTGVLHEAQILQLQMWPLILFECYSCDAKIDMANKMVLFNLDVKKKPSLKSTAKARETLTSWCRSILWNETEVDINFRIKPNDKPIRNKHKR